MLLGFTTALSIFGVALLASTLPAVAKEVTKNGEPNPTEVYPAPAQQPGVVSSQQITSALSGAAAIIYGLAISSGSFVIGIACSVVVVIGILKAQGK